MWSDLFGQVVIGCNTKALMLGGGDCLNAAGRVGLKCVNNANLDSIAECQMAPDPFQMLILSHSTHPKKHLIPIRLLHRASHHDIRHDKTIVTRGGNTDSLSINQEL